MIRASFFALFFLTHFAFADTGVVWSNGHGGGQYGSCAAACNAIGMPYNDGKACYPSQNHMDNHWATASCAAVKKSCELKDIKGTGRYGSHLLSFSGDKAPTMQRRCQNNCEVEYQRAKRKDGQGADFGGEICTEIRGKSECTSDYTALQTGTVCTPKPGENDDTKYNEVNNQPDGNNDPGASDNGNGNQNGEGKDDPNHPGKPSEPGQGHQGGNNGGAAGGDAGGNPGGGQGGAGADNKGDSGTADNSHHGGVGGGGGGGHHGGGGGGGSGSSGSGSGSGASGGGSGGNGDGGSGDGKGDGKGSISGGDCKTNKAPVCKGDPIQCYIAKEQWRTACLAERNGSSVSGGGDCSKLPECRGDEAQCYVVKKQHEIACAAKRNNDRMQEIDDFGSKNRKFFDTLDANGDEKGITESIGKDKIDLPKQFDTGIVRLPNQCPVIPPVNMGIFGVAEIPTDQFCDFARTFGRVMLAITYIVAFGIVVRAT